MTDALMDIITFQIVDLVIVIHLELDQINAMKMVFANVTNMERAFARYCSKYRIRGLSKQIAFF